MLACREGDPLVIEFTDGTSRTLADDVSVHPGDYMLHLEDKRVGFFEMIPLALVRRVVRFSARQGEQIERLDLRTYDDPTDNKARTRMIARALFVTARKEGLIVADNQEGGTRDST